MAARILAADEGDAISVLSAPEGPMAVGVLAAAGDVLRDFYRATARGPGAEWPYKLDGQPNAGENRLVTAVQLASRRLYEAAMRMPGERLLVDSAHCLRDGDVLYGIVAGRAGIALVRDGAVEHWIHGGAAGSLGHEHPTLAGAAAPAGATVVLWAGDSDMATDAVLSALDSEQPPVGVAVWHGGE
jgi:hypothetical protein